MADGRRQGRDYVEALTITSTVATYNNDGTVSLPLDPRMSDGRTGHVVVTLAFNPDLRAEADIPPVMTELLCGFQRQFGIQRQQCPWWTGWIVGRTRA